MTPGTDSNIQKLLAQMVADTSDPGTIPASLIRLHRNISCHEIADDMVSLHSDVVLSNGELISNTGHYCGDLHFTNPYDSARLQLITPIYYFEGENDPATPMIQARYYYDNQLHTKRIFVTVHGGGHNALALNLRDCSSQIWKAITQGTNELRLALSGCKLSTTLVASE